VAVVVGRAVFYLDRSLEVELGSGVRQLADLVIARPNRGEPRQVVRVRPPALRFVVILHDDPRQATHGIFLKHCNAS
jgi:hypothetical protein